MQISGSKRLNKTQRLGVFFAYSLIVLFLLLHNPFNGYVEFREFATGKHVYLLEEYDMIKKLIKERREYENEITEAYDYGYSPGEISNFITENLPTDIQKKAFELLKRVYEEHPENLSLEEIRKMEETQKHLASRIDFQQLFKQPKKSFRSLQSRCAYFDWIDQPKEFIWFSVLIALTLLVWLFVFKQKAETDSLRKE